MIFPPGLISKTNSGSGTDQDASLRIATLPPVPTTRCARRLEEELGTGRVIHAIVEIASARALRLFHARITAAKVSDPRRPYLLATDRG